jgi:hypothetical protein
MLELYLGVVSNKNVAKNWNSFSDKGNIGRGGLCVNKNTSQNMYRVIEKEIYSLWGVLTIEKCGLCIKQREKLGRISSFQV